MRVAHGPVRSLRGLPPPEGHRRRLGGRGERAAAWSWTTTTSTPGRAPDLPAGPVRRHLRGAADLRRRGPRASSAWRRATPAGRSPSARWRRWRASGSSRPSPSTTAACSSARRPRSVSGAHAALHDLLTGLPNRTLLLNRLAEQLEPRRPPARPRAAGARRRARVGADPARPRPVQGGQREPRPRGRRPAADRRWAGAWCARPVPPTPSPGSAATSSAILLGAGPQRPRGGARRGPDRARARASRSTSTGRTSTVGASLGIAIGRGRSRPTPATCSRRRRSRSTGRRRTRCAARSLFDPEMRAQTLDRATLEHDLRRAIERSELRLHYQPLVDLRHGRGRGRSRRSCAGSTRTAGSCRRCRSSRWPRRRASSCRSAGGSSRPPAAQLRDWQRRLPAAACLVVSVNLSARQFAQADLVADVAAILDHAGLDPAVAGAGDHRERGDGPVRGVGGAAARAAGARACGWCSTTSGPGYSSLVVPAPAAARHDQDRPLVRVRAG